MSILYKAYKDQIAFGKGRKVVFIKVMKTKSFRKIGEMVFLKPEDQILSENQRKWFSLRAMIT